MMPVFGLFLAMTSTISGAIQAQSAPRPVPISIPGEGGPVSAWVAGPEDATSAVLVMHDWFGISPMVLDAVHHLGTLGYRAVVLDLYEGQRATTHDSAGKLLGGLAPAKVARARAAAVAHLARPGRRLAVLGFSMGGAQALATAMDRPDDIDAVAIIYGGGLEGRSLERRRALTMPLFLMTGSQDSWAETSALAFRAEMAELDRAIELHIYPGAGHGYAQPLWQGGADLDPVATRTTWHILEDFLSRHLSEGLGSDQ